MMHKEGSSSITEEDVSLVLQRYSPKTILALLHEVSQVQDVNIDWNALLKNTKTGIKNPREYQMLWRHLAYCDPLLEKLERNAQPLDDDSDLECELEAFPTVSNEASAEAAACVKVLMASSSPSESCIQKGLVIEAPLTINIPTTKPQHPQDGSSASGVNMSFPVFVPTQLIPKVSSAEGSNNPNTCTNINLPPKRKRKPWSEEEDRELFTAVQRYGEGNWAHILKTDYKGDRTASQLSQRWNNIKRRQNPPVTKTAPQLSEVQLAARRAINMALDMPRVDTPKTTSLGTHISHNLQGVGQMGRPSLKKKIPVLPTMANPPSTSLAQNYNSTPTGPKGQFPRPQAFTSRPLASGPDAVKAAAVAAGARIATQAAAAAILQQQQLKSAIHIKTTRSPPAPAAHMGQDYFRAPCSRISPNTAHSNPSLAPAKVGPVVQLNQASTGHDIHLTSEP